MDQPVTDSEAIVMLLNQFSPFVPNCAGPTADIFAQTLLSASQSLSMFARLARLSQKPLAILDITAFASQEPDPEQLAATQVLAQLFQEHGSDKATVHDYHLIYGRLLARPQTIRSLLEIGLGTQDPAFVSHMETGYRPGASLRAFRDWLPEACIFGADLDRKVLFQEDRIQTFFVDQTVPESLDGLRQQLPAELDIIIDDGLHTPYANINTLTFALGCIRPGGWIVIEDIPERARDTWQIAAALLPPGFSPCLIRTRHHYVFVVQRDG